MKIPIELSAESRDLLVRHFKEGTDLHEILEHAVRKELPSWSRASENVALTAKLFLKSQPLRPNLAPAIHGTPLARRRS